VRHLIGERLLGGGAAGASHHAGWERGAWCVRRLRSGRIGRSDRDLWSGCRCVRRRRSRCVRRGRSRCVRRGGRGLGCDRGALASPNDEARGQCRSNETCSTKRFREHVCFPRAVVSRRKYGPNWRLRPYPRTRSESGGASGECEASRRAPNTGWSVARFDSRAVEESELGFVPRTDIWEDSGGKAAAARDN